MEKKIKIKFRDKYLNIFASEVSFLGKFFGLMFRSKNTNNLLFEFSKDAAVSMHSLFVFFPFLAVWLDGKNNVIEYKIVKPFTLYIKPKKRFDKILEFPINRKNNKIIKFFVGRRKV